MRIYVKRLAQGWGIKFSKNEAITITVRTMKSLKILFSATRHFIPPGGS